MQNQKQSGEVEIMHIATITNRHAQLTKAWLRLKRINWPQH